MKTRATLRAEMIADVRAMKAEGVARWGDLIIDPRHLAPPADAKPVMLDPVAKAQRAIERDAHRKEVMFAATSVRPRTPEPRDFSHVAPRGVTPSERDDGTPTQQ